MDHMLSFSSFPWLEVSQSTGSNQPMGSEQQPHPREANGNLCELSAEAVMAGSSINFVPDMSPSMTLGYTLGRLGLPLDIQSIVQGFSFGITDAFSYNNIGNLDCFTNPFPTDDGVLSSQTGVQSFSGQVWSPSGSPYSAEEYPASNDNSEGFLGSPASRLTEEYPGNLHSGDTCEMGPSSILYEQRKEITAGSLSPINPGSQDDNVPEILTESRSEGIIYGQSNAFSVSVEALSSDAYSPSCDTESPKLPQDNISFAQGQESDQEAATHPESCINLFGCHTQSPEPEVPETIEEPSSPMRPSIDIIDLTLDSDTTPAETVALSTADAGAKDLPVMPNGISRWTESSRSKRRNQQKRKRCHEDVPSLPEVVTLRVISVKVEKENGYGCMETVEFIRHKSRKWKAKESNEECILKLQEVVSFEMMVQGGSFGRINIHKSEDGNTYKGTEPLMEYMVELSKDDVEKVLDDPEKSLGTPCHLLQEQNRSKAPRVV